MEHAFDNTLESAVTAAVQVTAILAAIGTADVVAMAIARISAGRVTLPIAVVEFTAAAALIDFAAELRGGLPTAMSAATAIAAAVALARAAGVAFVATAADKTIHHAMFVVPAMRTSIGDGQKSNNDSEPNELMHEHRELPPGRNLERR